MYTWTKSGFNRVIVKRVIVLAAALLLAVACTKKDENFKPLPKGAGQGDQAEKTKSPEKTVAPMRVTAPLWRKGDEWKYSDGYGLRVTGVNGNVTIFQRTDDPKQWFSRHGFLREEAQSRNGYRKVVFRSVPPSRGLELSADNGLVFTREYLLNDQLRVHQTSWVVEGRETISVPAGEYDCLIIVMRTRSLRSGWKGFERWWYSPKTKHYVRMEYKYGGQQMSSRVLVSYNIMKGP